MQIQVNAGNDVEGHDQLADHVRSAVVGALGRFRGRVTRVEVHITDPNSDKSGPDDKRCMMEARLEGRRPAAVTHQAATVEQAVDGAADRLARVVESTLGRLRDEASRRTDPAPPGPQRPEHP